MGLTIMPRTYLLRQWFGLPDPGMEEAFYESAVLQRFAGVDLGVAATPDETTILRFRHLLEQHDLCGQMLDTLNRYLETKGIYLFAPEQMPGRAFCKLRMKLAIRSPQTYSAVLECRLLWGHHGLRYRCSKGLSMTWHSWMRPTTFD